MPISDKREYRAIPLMETRAEDDGAMFVEG